MAFIRNTDKFVEGSSNRFFTDGRAQLALQETVSSLESEDSGMKLRLDVIEGGSGVSGSIAKAQADAQAYADQQIAALVNSAPSVLDTLKELSDAIGGDASFASTVAGQIGDVDDKIDQEIADRQAAISALESSMGADVSALESADAALSLRLDELELDPVTKSYVDSEMSAEESARQSADSALSGRLDVLESDPVTKTYVDGEVSDLQGQITQEISDRQSAISGVQGEIEAEETRAMAAEGLLDGRLDVLEGVGEGSVAKAEQDAKDYADGLDSAMDARMLVLEADPTTKTYVDGEVSDLQGQITQEISDRQADVDAEEQRALAAEGLLSGRLDVLEADPVEKSYVDSQDSGLQSQIDTEKGRIDAILLSADADKDSFAEIVQLINSVDTENDNAFAGYVLSNDAAVEAVEGRLDVIEGAGEGSVAKAEQDAKDYADSVYANFNSDFDTRLATKSTDNLSEGSNLYYTQGRFDSAFAAKSTSDLSEGSNLYFTDARAKTASVVNSSTGSQTDQAMSVSAAKAYTDTRLKLDGTNSMTGALAFATSMTISSYGSVFSVASPTAPLAIGKGMRVPYLGVSGNVSASSSSAMLLGVTSVSSARTITLPAAATMGAGRMIVVKDETGSASASNYIRIQPSGGQLIDGESYYDITVPYESVMVYTNGTHWFII